MSKKIGTGLEKHIDKIIFAAAGLVGLYVLYMYVLTSPNVVEYNGNRYGPVDLDKAIYEQAKGIEDTLARPPKEGTSYQSKFSDINSTLAAPIKVVSGKFFPVPSARSADE
ncbi:MAG: hypothetical protein Q7T18_10250, partial [Sedimentisphaerales bacterium]|nr:hypothetical protein [Sedimentisphaerales bacterium]